MIIPHRTWILWTLTLQISEVSRANEMENYALGNPPELINQTLEGEPPLEHPGFDTSAATLPQSIKAIDSLLFDTFFHEAYDKNWSVE
jgi:hypothetical protein